jgi:hypothetical protein
LASEATNLLKNFERLLHFVLCWLLRTNHVEFIKRSTINNGGNTTANHERLGEDKRHYSEQNVPIEEMHPLTTLTSLTTNINQRPRESRDLPKEGCQKD